MMDMFGYDRHSAGGKVTRKLPPDVKGDATFFGPRDCYRPVLRRWIGEEFPDNDFMMIVGMNPSSAEGHVDDSTIFREWGFTRREGFAGLYKMNICDYRATKPSALLKVPAEDLCSEINFDAILGAAMKAKKIVMAHGNLNRVLKPIGRKVHEALRADGHKLWCFGTNADGSPKHPLYVL